MRIGLLQPKYWPTWIGLGVLRGISLMPFAAQRRVGEALGLLIRHLPLSYVRIARRNIELCMPDLSSEQREDLLDLHCRSLGLALCETATTFWSSDARVRELGEIVGLEHIQAALKLGRGAILIGGHFTTLEITTRILGTVMPLNVVFRPTKNALLAHTMYSSFCRHGKPIAHDDIRAMVRALKRNEAVWYAPDQSYRNKGAEMVKFFGIPAATNTATSRLARISGAPVMTYFPERLPTGKYRINIGEPFADFPGPDVIQDAQRFHALLEKQILKYPEQYLWMHRRFKGLSADYPDYYGRDSRRRGPAPAQSNN
jgi:Kdo2-lipid IVA lauroyltransferase/acyltransferase